MIIIYIYFRFIQNRYKMSHNLFKKNEANPLAVSLHFVTLWDILTSPHCWF